MIYLAIYLAVGVVYCVLGLCGQVVAARRGDEHLRIPLRAWALLCAGAVVAWPIGLAILALAVRRGARA